MLRMGQREVENSMQNNMKIMQQEVENNAEMG